MSRETVAGLINAEQVGGLSGKPLNALSTKLIMRLAKELNGALPIIGSGGIHSLASGQEKIDAGAKLLQVYSGLIYEGPGLIQTLVKHIRLKNQ